MTTSPALRMSLWIVPIVIAVCALMILPAGAFLQGHERSSGSQAATATGAPAARTVALPHATIPANPWTHPTASAPAPSGRNSALISGVQNLLSSGKVPTNAIYLPNYRLLNSPASNPKSAISLYYSGSPAPMGVGDFGLDGIGSYEYNTTSIQGSFTLKNYNATAGGLYEDTGAYYWDGLSPNANIGPYQSGIQLNTVEYNVSIPGSTTASFWTQNVLDLNGNSMQFIDNVWNFSGGGLNPGTLYSYNGTPVYPQFYYDYGPILPLTFPVTVNLYNNASIVNGRTEVTFGYAIGEGGKVYHGIYDPVVFNSKSAPNPAVFQVNGFNLSPAGALYDSELVWTGPGAGSHARTLLATRQIVSNNSTIVTVSACARLTGLS